MRIAVFTTAYLPFVGGAEIAVREISRRLPDIQFDIYTARLLVSLPAKETDRNVTIYRLGSGRFYDKWQLAFWGHQLVGQWHLTKPYDLVWSIMASFGGLAARNFKYRQPATPLLLTIQEGDDLNQIKRKGRFLFGAFSDIFRQADQIQAISNFLADWAQEMGARAPVAVIPNGVDLNLFKFRNFQPDNHRSVIITISRLVAKNGISDLIAALALMPANVELRILGDGSLKNKLIKQVKKLNLADRVFFHGFISYQELPKYLAAADVFVRPALSEGLGNAFLEAMAVGVPIIGTPVGGIPDFLKDGETGWFGEPKNPKSVAEKINYVLNRENNRKVEAVIRRARATVEQKYDWDIIALQFRNLFNSIIRR